MRKTKVDASSFLLILIALLLAGGVFFVVTFLRPDSLKESFSGDRVINTLFIIEDGNEPNAKPLCAYVLMYYPATRRAAVFDIPGSLGLIIQRMNRVDRIDMVYDSRRIAPFAKEIENLLGLEIPFSVVITLENLGKITDLIEGVELFIPASVDEYRDERILFPSGVSRLDGDKARVYITYELPEENMELVTFRRQRFFIGLLKRLGEQNRFLKNPQAANIFQALVKTGINQKSQMRLFSEFAVIDTDRINFQSVGGNIRDVSGQALVFPHWDGNLIKEIVRETLAGLVQPVDSVLGDRVLTVEVLNGTVLNGLAGRTAELLRGFGYDIISIGNADRNDYEKTLIIDRSGFEGMVKDFGDVIRCSNVSYESAGLPAGISAGLPEAEIDFNIQNFEYQPDITLIIGKDFNGRYVTE
jgi:anionic cell wall polymer biosynthesis LytR-Cps2A-Psr (LCP) family protein